MSLPQNQGRIKRDPVDPSLDRSLTRCCVITGRGRGAVAVVAVNGPKGAEAVRQCFRGASAGAWLAGQIRYGSWIGTSTAHLPPESVVVTPLHGGDIEVHCHGGPAAISRIVADLHVCGVQVVEQKDWVGGGNHLLIDEACQVLMRCLTARTAAIAMDQYRGAMLRWARHLLQSIQRLEVSLDHATREAERLLQSAPLGLHLSEPFRVVLVGPPNVGKSSLLNAIVGYDRSITFDSAGTTRDVLHAETVIDGWPIRLSDTAGIRISSDPIEREGVQRARALADQADLLLCVTEPALIGSQDAEPANPIVEAAISAGIPLIRLLNKSDLLHSLQGQSAANLGFDVITNALTQQGIEPLIERIARRLGQHLPGPGEPVVICVRQRDALQQLAQAATIQQAVDALQGLIGSEDASENF